MTLKSWKQKVLGGVLALGIIGGIGMSSNSSSTANAAPFWGRRVVVVERRPVFVPPVVVVRGGFYGPRFYHCR